ncbi:hypothetical protein [Burkholderia ubonensis]|uniref:hypothetical protein n=1 Tax=Burkholderia ubonensis TaxID=101571 RepID=UPI00075A5306|nr:hypothetical protein [Burkholderia ubonensis]KVP39949.1 hypothetical protein WJ87_07125 [Burkholderia ubonensis]
MCQKTLPATQEQLTKLRDPAALAAIDVIKKTGWLAADAKSLDKFFAADPNHPAKTSLDEEARNGGAFAVFQFAVLIGFVLLAISISSFQATLSPMVFVLWGALGVCAGLLASRYPGRVFGKRKTRA